LSVEKSNFYYNSCSGGGHNQMYLPVKRHRSRNIKMSICHGFLEGRVMFCFPNCIVTSDIKEMLVVQV